MTIRILALATALLTLGLASVAHAQLSCSTVARAGQLDPDGQVLTNAFRDQVAVNASGDAAFVARALGARDKLYFYPIAGSAQVVARSDGPAPSGGTFRSQRAFFALSVNEADDVSFFAQLVAGQGVFIRAGGALETGAMRSQASPTGGTFNSFPMVGEIDTASRVPFVATVDGGSGGAFVYASASNTVSPLVLDGAATTDGRQVCSTMTIDLGNAGFAVLRATSKVDCMDGVEPARPGIFVVTPLGLSTVALDGDAAPIGGSTFAKFLDTPRINAANDVAFRATTAGSTKTDGIFVWDFATDTFSTAVRKGDAVPAVGGSIGSNQSFDFDDAGDVILNARLKVSPAKFGLFEFGVADRPLLVRTDAPPTDAFGVGATFMRLSRLNDTSADGSEIALQVRVKDTVPPTAKVGVIRCATSPSGAFVDGAAVF